MAGCAFLSGLFDFEWLGTAIDPGVLHERAIYIE
jgi:hypothetical protein